MCTYLTKSIPLKVSAKGPEGWFTTTEATVYVDHPAHAPADHTLNIDFINRSIGPGARVALELDAAAARALARAIDAALDEAPEGLLP